MNRLLSIYCLLCMTLFVKAQSFEPKSWQAVPSRWIAQQGGDGCQDVWFCNSYSFQEKPYKAHLQIATAGWVEVFVNGRNIDNAVLAPAKPANSDEMTVFEYDIRRFMRNGKNTIVINYCPRYCHGGKENPLCTICSTTLFDNKAEGIETDSLWFAEWDRRRETSRVEALAAALTEPVGQISIKFYGENMDDTLFETWADNSWLCCNGRRCLTPDGGEMLDGRKSDFRNGFDGISPMQWTPAVVTNKKPKEKAVFDDNAYPVGNILIPQYKKSKGNTFVYEFSPAYYGFVRATLRRCKKGDHLRIGSLRYICNGSFDEQAYGKFAPQTFCGLSITGPQRFSRDNISLIEGLSLVNNFQ